MKEHRPTRPTRRRDAVPVGELLPAALRALGMPSARLTRRVHLAWQRAAEPSWAGLARPLRLEGGVLVVGVDSSSLRHELAHFHAERLLDVLRTALPDVPLVALRFVTGGRPVSPPGGFPARGGDPGERS